jgi:prolipoprotein diacylglyceryl transferase
MINAIIWDVSPVAISVGPFAVRWYGMLFALGIVLCYYIFQYIFKAEKLPPLLLDKYAVWAVLSTVIGARLGHVLFYEPAYYFQHPSEILMIWHGGLASHGATIGLIIYVFWFCYRHGIPYLWLFDRMAIIVSVGSACIRLGNLMNSEIIGTPTNVPWAFIFTSEDMIPRHPSQLYEALVYLSLFIFLFWRYKKVKGEVKGGQFVGIMFLVIFVSRFLIEFIKSDQVDFEKGMLLNMGQWLSIPFVLIGIAFIIISFTHKSIPKVTALKRFPK